MIRPLNRRFLPKTGPWKRSIRQSSVKFYTPPELKMWAPIEIVDVSEQPDWFTITIHFIDTRTHIRAVVALDVLNKDGLPDIERWDPAISTVSTCCDCGRAERMNSVLKLEEPIIADCGNHIKIERIVFDDTVIYTEALFG